MVSVSAYTAAGVKSAAKTTLDKTVFGVEVKNHGLLRDAYQSYLDNGRVNLAKTKTRGEVVGSTKKPWKQKGTGRARFGSKYNPIWRGGGITFGPTGNENYSKKINHKAKQLAIKQALSLAAAEDRVKVIETFNSKDGKVAQTAQLLDKIEAKGSVLVVVSIKDALVERATRNLPNVKLVQANYLNAFDVMNADTLVVSKKSLDAISQWLSTKPRPVVKKAQAQI